MTPEQIEVERKAFESDRRALGWDADRLIRFRGESWFGSQETMPTYRSDWTEGQWLGWLARAEKAQRVRDALEELIAAQDDWSNEVDMRGMGADPEGEKAQRIDLAWEAARTAAEEDHL
jgi:hypothetical protein